MAETKAGPLSPYVTQVNDKDPMVRKVPCESMPIAANAASMPKGSESGSPGSIEHVGGGKK